jgi:hypothetical protein
MATVNEDQQTEEGTIGGVSAVTSLDIGEVAPLTSADLTALLEQDLDAFLLRHVKDTVLSASRVINELLELWDVAMRIDPEVSAPLERLLVALSGRELTSADELSATLAEVRRALEARASTIGV